MEPWTLEGPPSDESSDIILQETQPQQERGIVVEYDYEAVWNDIYATWTEPEKDIFFEAIQYSPKTVLESVPTKSRIEIRNYLNFLRNCALIPPEDGLVEPEDNEEDDLILENPPTELDAERLEALKQLGQEGDEYLQVALYYNRDPQSNNEKVQMFETETIQRRHHQSGNQANFLRLQSVVHFKCFEIFHDLVEYRLRNIIQQAILWYEAKQVENLLEEEVEETIHVEERSRPKKRKSKGDLEEPAPKKAKYHHLRLCDLAQAIHWLNYTPEESTGWVQSELNTNPLQQDHVNMSDYFHLSQEDAATALGVSVRILKYIWKTYSGGERWPQRGLEKINRLRSDNPESAGQYDEEMQQLMQDVWVPKKKFFKEDKTQKEKDGSKTKKKQKIDIDRIKPRQG